MKKNKPTIFFSHSSQDSEAITRLRTAILNQGGNAFQIFCSSDGESIPFGTNWVHKIEAALNEADLVFLFLSPHSIVSQWVFFEAGFFYGRQKAQRAATERKIVPVAINGLQIGKLRPPISLLQGFNLDGPDKINNLLSIIRDEFELTFPDFDAQVFNNVFDSNGQVLSTRIITDTVEVLRFNFKYEGDFFERFASNLRAGNFEYFETSRDAPMKLKKIESSGAECTFYCESPHYFLVIHSEVLQAFLPILIDILPKELGFELVLQEGFAAVSDFNRRAKLHGTELKLTTGGGFRLRSNTVRFEKKDKSKRIWVVGELTNGLEVDWFAGMLRILIEREVFYFDDAVPME